MFNNVFFFISELIFFCGFRVRLGYSFSVLFCVSIAKGLVRLVFLIESREAV